MKGIFRSLLSCIVMATIVSGHGRPRARPNQDLSIRSSKEQGKDLTSSLFFNDGVINLEHLEKELDRCEVVQELNYHIEHEHEHAEESLIERVFEKLFPFGAAWNSVLATLYISGPPNLILAFIPASINPSKLSMLVSFAVGGLLGDVFLHLLPQTFLGEPVDPKAHFVLVDEKRNAVLGVFIFIGFAFFFSIDKFLRIINHGEEDAHSHSHSHSHSPSHAPVAESSALEGKDSSGLKKRGASKNDNKYDNGDEEKEKKQTVSASVRTAAWLNLISDFTHNITDGLAITSAFYISRSVGSTTALAVFLHEVPHEIGDFAVLIQGGFTKWQAMNSQFVTAAGAFLGCFIGIGVQKLATRAVATTTESIGFEGLANTAGLFGTTVTISDLTLPFTAGGFLYIATVGVIPEVLELAETTTKFAEAKKALGQLFFILLGISLMLGISWFE